MSKKRINKGIIAIITFQIALQTLFQVLSFRYFPSPFREILSLTLSFLFCFGVHQSLRFNDTYRKSLMRKPSVGRFSMISLYGMMILAPFFIAFKAGLLPYLHAALSSIDLLLIVSSVIGIPHAGFRIYEMRRVIRKQEAVIKKKSEIFRQKLNEISTRFLNPEFVNQNSELLKIKNRNQWLFTFGLFMLIGMACYLGYVFWDYHASTDYLHTHLLFKQCLMGTLILVAFTGLVRFVFFLLAHHQKHEDQHHFKKHERWGLMIGLFIGLGWLIASWGSAIGIGDFFLMQCSHLIPGSLHFLGKNSIHHLVFLHIAVLTIWMVFGLALARFWKLFKDFQYKIFFPSLFVRFDIKTGIDQKQDGTLFDLYTSKDKKTKISENSFNTHQLTYTTLQRRYEYLGNCIGLLMGIALFILYQPFIPYESWGVNFVYYGMGMAASCASLSQLAGRLCAIFDRLYLVQFQDLGLETEGSHFISFCYAPPEKKTELDRSSVILDQFDKDKHKKQQHGAKR